MNTSLGESQNLEVGWIKGDQTKIYLALNSFKCGVKSGNLRHEVKSDIHLQTVEMLMRRLIKSGLIKIFTVCIVSFFILIIKI